MERVDGLDLVDLVEIVGGQDGLVKVNLDGQVGLDYLVSMLPPDILDGVDGVDQAELVDQVDHLDGQVGVEFRGSMLPRVILVGRVGVDLLVNLVGRVLLVKRVGQDGVELEQVVKQVGLD
jgi:hypothetical protein